MKRLLRTDRDQLSPGTMSGGTGLGATAMRLLVVLLTVGAAFVTLMGVLALLPGRPPPFAPSDGRIYWVATGVIAAFAMLAALFGGLLTTVRTMFLLPVTVAAGALGGYFVAIRDTNLQLVCALAAPLLLVAPALLYPFRLRRMWSLVAFGAGLVALLPLASSNQSDLLSLANWLRAAVGVLIVAVPALLGSFALKGVGDAARYLSDSPDNVAERESIRHGLIALLRELQQAVDPRTGRYTYERVLVVGHSLGSVIAYDAVTSLWTQTHQRIAFPEAHAPMDRYPLGAVAARVEQAADRLRTTTTTAVDHAEWLAAQSSLRVSLRAELAWKDGGLWRQPDRWVISDLVTVGSPLTYAEILLADGLEDLRLELTDRRLASCPPVRQITEPGASEHPLRYVPRRGVTKLHQAACFAVTTWTNLYFTHDLVGGPLSPRLGSGIRDFALAGKGSNLLWFFRAYPHSSYWGGRSGSVNRRGSRTSLDILRELLVRQSPVLLASGSPRRVKAFRDALTTSGLQPAPRTHGDTAPDPVIPSSVDSTYFEIRVLRVSAKSTPPRAWTWLGFDPWFRTDDLEEVAALAQTAGLVCSFSDGSPSTMRLVEDEDDEPSDELSSSEDEADLKEEANELPAGVAQPHDPVP